MRGAALPLLWQSDFRNDLGFPVTSSPALSNQNLDPGDADCTTFLMT